jgi:gliding motility-associated-like protein
LGGVLKLKKLITVFLLLLCTVISTNAQRSFVENKGQWNEKVLFRAAFDGQIIYLTQEGFSFLDYDKKSWTRLMESHHQEESKLNKAKHTPNKYKVKYHHYKLNFSGQTRGTQISGQNPLLAKSNFFIGDDPEQWASDVLSYQNVLYKNIYPNIDLEVVITDSSFKYNFILQKNANIDDIRLQYEGLDNVALKFNKLHLTNIFGVKKEAIPVSYVLDNPTETVDIRYRLNGNTVSFYSKSNVESGIVIDPEVVFATYAGNSADNFGFTATYDSLGSLYGGGITTTADLVFDKTGRYPATIGSFDITYNGGLVVDGRNSDYSFPCDITISKYNPDGSSLIYATYIGGNSNEYPHSLVVDDDMNLIILGSSFSQNYPKTSNAFQRNLVADSDIIITKLNKDGNKLIGSTFIGGSSRDGLNEGAIIKFFYADNFRGDVITDSLGNVYAAMHTKSLDFPTSGSPVQVLNGGKQDGVVFKLNPDLSNLIWSTYLGGNQDDALYSIDFDTLGDIYVSGGTRSNNLKGTGGTVYPNYGGGASDGFIAVLSSDGQRILRSTYWGGGNYDQIFSLDLDENDDVYIVGQTFGGLGVIGEVYNVPNSGQFIAKMDKDLRNIEFQTLFGTGDGYPDITINAFLVDECQKIFVSGWGGGTSLKTYSSTRNLPITKDAYQKTTDGSDFYLIVLSKDARELLYATYFGGYKTDDHVDGGTSRFDKKGVIYQSVCASCPEPGSGDHAISDFPTTAGSYSPYNRSPRCSNATFKIAFGNLNRRPEPRDTLKSVMALDTISFNYTVSDPDWDSLFVYFSPDSQIRANLLQTDTFFADFKSVSSTLVINADCEDVGDTFDIAVYAVDRGCPSIKDSFATIKVVVTPPPLLDPPETICLKFSGDNEVRLEWNEITENPYFLVTRLYRTDPNGVTIILDSFYTTAASFFVDKTVTNARNRNYTYFLVTLNRCNKPGPSSYKVSSTKEFESPIDASYLITATVVDNKDVKVVWSATTEGDFGNYDIYRRANTPSAEFVHYASTYERTDTMFIDTKVDVQHKSYCYAIVVNDDCGHISRKSNVGCNIVLSGESVPWKHTLHWNKYQDWQADVNNYELSRSVDTGILWPRATMDASTLGFEDEVFDYDWGGYWYEILAKENPGDYNAESRSNRIYLIQPPLLHVPNAFTVNRDNLNEVWGIVPVFVREYELNVFNRWGERVFHSIDKKKQWDGYYKGVQETNLVYIYTITYTGWDNSIHRVKGTVTILK